MADLKRSAKMVIFTSESEVREVLDKADALIAAGAVGSFDFRSFHAQLGHLHGYYALDGHESDEEEVAILDRYRARIQWIERVLEEISGICADEDATKEAYIRAGRFGTDEALRRLRALIGGKEGPNQPPQRNAGSCPSSDDSSASETSSSLGPRG